MDNQVFKDIKHKVAHYLRDGITIFCVAALSSVVTYIACNHVHEKTLDELNDQIKQLKAEEQEAKVTKRISEQMEDIAYQQKNISDRQTARAIHEAQLADIARNTAEFERSNAQKAERAARISAIHADSMSAIAEKQKELALENLNVAQRAKAQSDTLFYKSLSNSLAQSSLSLSNADTDLSRLLAYASWHYARQYANGVEDGSLYKALINAPALSSSRLAGVTKGDIRCMEVVTVNGARYAIGTSDYGEIIYVDSLNQPFYIHPSIRYYRDMALTSNHHYATITADGIVSLIDYNAEIIQHRVVPQETTLPDGIWSHIVTSPDETMLIALSQDKVVWLSSTDLHIIATAEISGKATMLGYAGNTLHVFGESDVHYISTTPGTLSEGGSLTRGYDLMVNRKTSEDNHHATAFCYDKQHNYLILGFSCGDIEYHNPDGTLIRVLSGHNSGITHIELDGDVLISTSYNYEARFWSVHDISSIIVAAVQNFNKWPETFALDEKSKIMWIGFANGEIQHFSYSAEENAALTHSLLRREFTTPEWDYYIGPTIPYRTFINENNENNDK